MEGLWGYENDSNVDQDFRKPQDKDKKLQLIPLAIISLESINLSVFVTDMECVY